MLYTSGVPVRAVSSVSPQLTAPAWVQIHQSPSVMGSPRRVKGPTSWAFQHAARPQPPQGPSKPALMSLRDLSNVRPETEVVNAGDVVCGKVTVLAQTHGGYMTMVSYPAVLRELIALKPRHIFVEGLLKDGTVADAQRLRRRVKDTLRSAGDDPARRGSDFLKLMSEVGPGAIYAALVDPTVKVHAVDVPRNVRQRAFDRGGTKALADVTFNVRERKVFNDVVAVLRAEPGSEVAVVYGYGHDFRRIGGEFLGRDGFNPRFVWKNTSGCTMSQVRAMRQEGLSFLAGNSQQKVDYRFELDKAHPPWMDAFVQNLLRDVDSAEAAA